MKEDDRLEELGQVADRITIGAVILSKSKLAINYILGGPSDDQYQSKLQQKKILRAAIVKARINVIHTEGSHENPTL